MRKMIFAALALLGLVSGAVAQSVGGALTVTAGTTSAATQFPTAINTTTYPSLLIHQGVVTPTAQAYFALGTSSSVTASASTSPAIPPQGICVNVGPDRYIATVASAASTSVYLTWLTTCPY